VTTKAGRSPSGRASRPTDQAATRLGDTATIPNASFAEEFPALTKLGRGFGLWLLGIAASSAVTGIGIAAGVPPHLTGWLSCMAFLVTARLWRPEQ
jgi:hypothetical protein